jgi:hypothetical protein
MTEPHFVNINGKHELTVAEFNAMPPLIDTGSISASFVPLLSFVEVLGAELDDQSDDPINVVLEDVILGSHLASALANIDDWYADIYGTEHHQYGNVVTICQFRFDILDIDFDPDQDTSVRITRLDVTNYLAAIEAFLNWYTTEHGDPIASAIVEATTDDVGGAA